ncbi:MAG: hypothetical protein GX410_06810, partial [Elusimicrobia bacterium]|nr:hypothetical protein [Elusimicrobiota bacterium]
MQRASKAVNDVSEKIIELMVQNRRDAALNLLHEPSTVSAVKAEAEGMQALVKTNTDANDRLAAGAERMARNSMVTLGIGAVISIVL